MCVYLVQDSLDTTSSAGSTPKPKQDLRVSIETGAARERVEEGERIESRNKEDEIEKSCDEPETKSKQVGEGCGRSATIVDMSERDGNEVITNMKGKGKYKLVI